METGFREKSSTHTTHAQSAGGDIGSEILTRLQREYVIIGKRRVQSRLAWLLIGIAAGMVLTLIIFLTKNSAF